MLVKVTVAQVVTSMGHFFLDTDKTDPEEQEQAALAKLKDAAIVWSCDAACQSSPEIVSLEPHPHPVRKSLIT